MCAMNNRAAFACLSRPVALSAKSLAAMILMLQVNTGVAQTAVNGTEATTFRSLPEAVDGLDKRYGYVITVETPPYVYEGDLQDERALRNPGSLSKSTAPPIWVAKGVPVSLNLPPAASVDRAGMSSIVRQLAQNGSKGDHGAHFRTEQEGDVFHIIPTEVRDRTGNWVAHTPLFDTRISIPTKERSMLDTVQAVCDALAAANHVSVRLLVYPLNTLHYTNSTVGASDEAARSVLTRALTGLDRKLTWRVFYDIPMNSYLLSMLFVQNRTPLATPRQAIPAAQTLPGGVQ
jgi:hypothetical protein